MADHEHLLADDDLGPPVLLKKLRDAVEANLAKNKLATAGIPSFLGGENAFAGDVMQPLPYREVELFVPESLVHEALAVLDAPLSDPEELASEPFLDDPGRVISVRAFVAAIVGWCLFVLGPYGFLFAAPAFASSLYLAIRSFAVGTERGGAMIFNSVAAVLVSLGGLVACGGVVVLMSR